MLIIIFLSTLHLVGIVFMVKSKRSHPFDHSAFKTFLKNRQLVLIGMMGAGKSSVGRRLAKVLHLDFVDADHEIEKAARQSIADIFKTHGEASFRDGERRVIKRLLQCGPKVLATGGGAVMNEETRTLIKQHGISIWLKADLSLLIARVKRKPTRPLLQQPNPEHIMAELLKKREPYYAQADLTVKTYDAPHERVVNDILKALNTMMKANNE